MKYRHLILLLIVFASCLYGLTWSARPTWVHFGEDGPELEAAGRVLGIPHPTGYPLLLLLVRVVSLGVRPPVSALNVVTLLAAILAVAAVGAAGRALARKVWKGEDGVSFAGVLENPGYSAQKGKGMKGARVLVEKKVDAVVAKALGEGPFHTLRDALIDIYAVEEGSTVRDVARDLLEGKLRRVTSPEEAE